jgi:predicted transcriptional regulator
MSVSAFTCILLLRKREDSARILEMLPAGRRTVVETELKSIMNLSPAEIHEQLNKLRKEQLHVQSERAQERVSRPLDRASPRLIAWLGRPF